MHACDGIEDDEDRSSVAKCVDSTPGCEVSVVLIHTGVDPTMSTVEDGTSVDAAANFAANELITFGFGVTFVGGVDFLSSSCFLISARRSLTVIAFGSSDMMLLLWKLYQNVYLCDDRDLREEDNKNKKVFYLYKIAVVVKLIYNIENSNSNII